MTNEKFKSELDSLDSFFTTFCRNKHINQVNELQDIKYKDKIYPLQTNLCKECKELLNYSIERLTECPHEIKPRCRRCPTPCYEKDKWKKVAKLMRYSGIKLGILKIKKFFI